MYFYYITGNFVTELPESPQSTLQTHCLLGNLIFTIFGGHGAARYLIRFALALLQTASLVCGVCWQQSPGLLFRTSKPSLAKGKDSSVKSLDVLLGDGMEVKIVDNAVIWLQLSHSLLSTLGQRHFKAKLLNKINQMHKL